MLIVINGTFFCTNAYGWVAMRSIL